MEKMQGRKWSMAYKKALKLFLWSQKLALYAMRKGQNKKSSIESLEKAKPSINLFEVDKSYTIKYIRQTPCLTTMWVNNMYTLSKFRPQMSSKQTRKLTIQNF